MSIFHDLIKENIGESDNIYILQFWLLYFK